jgi:hypothetical protein
MSLVGSNPTLSVPGPVAFSLRVVPAALKMRLGSRSRGEVRE